MTEKLGPCPLCGRDARMNDYGEVTCSSCDMPYVDIKIWTKLSALAEQNKRRGEVLERCRDHFRECDRTTRGPSPMERMCEEALK